MTILYLTNPTSSSFNWQVGTLSNPFNSDHYMEMVIATGTTSAGSTTRPSGVMGSVTAPAVRSAHNTPISTASGSPGTTYNLNAYARTLSGRYYPAGSASITLRDQTVTPMPTNVIASGSSSTELYITWTRMSGVTQYRVRINGVIRTTTDTTMYWGGLSPDTLYTVEVQSHNPNNDIPYSGWRSTTARTLQQTVTPMPTSVTATGTTSSELRISWTSVSSATQYRVRINGVIRTTTGNETTMYWGGLSPDTLYTVEVQSHNPNNDIPYSGWRSTTGRTLAPSRPGIPENIRGEPGSSSSIQVSWDPVSGAQYYELRFVSPLSETFRVYGTTYKVTGLSPDTQYMFQVRTINNNADISDSLWSGYRYARTLKGRPGKWGWDRTIVSGGSFHITYTEWNRFTEMINEVREYKGLSRRDFTQAVRGEPFYAFMFNEARNGISNMNPPTSVPDWVNPGDDITAFIFNRIMNSLNSIE